MGAIFSAASSNMSAPSDFEGTVPHFVQCDGHFIADASGGAVPPFVWFRLEGHGALYWRATADGAETVGAWEVVDAATARLTIGGAAFSMAAADDVHNTVVVAPPGTTFAFVDEEGAR